MEQNPGGNDDFDNFQQCDHNKKIQTYNGYFIHLLNENNVTNKNHV